MNDMCICCCSSCWHGRLANEINVIGYLPRRFGFVVRWFRHRKPPKIFEMAGSGTKESVLSVFSFIILSFSSLFFSFFLFLGSRVLSSSCILHLACLIDLDRHFQEVDCSYMWQILLLPKSSFSVCVLCGVLYLSTTSSSSTSNSNCTIVVPVPVYL